MAKQDLQHLLVALSRFSNLGNDFKKEPDRVMTEAELSADEKKLVSDGDANQIRAYLGDAFPSPVKIAF